MVSDLVSYFHYDNINGNFTMPVFSQFESTEELFSLFFFSHE